MHLFEFTTLFYLSFHAIAYALMFVSIMGTPGNPNETKPFIKLLLQIASIFLVMAWKGLPALAIASVLAFFFHYDLLGKILSCISLGLGLGLFSAIVLYYLKQSKK